MGTDTVNQGSTVRERKKDGKQAVVNQIEAKKEVTKKPDISKNSEATEQRDNENKKKVLNEQENDKVIEDLGTSCCKLLILTLFLLLVLLLSLLLLLVNNTNFAFHTNLFDSTTQQRYAQRTQDQQIRVPVSLEDIYFGNLINVFIFDHFF